jgi:hypothetical protein
MLRYVAARTYRLIVRGERNDAFRHTFHGMPLERIGGNTALAGGVRDQDPRLPIRLRTGRPNPGLTGEEPMMAAAIPLVSLIQIGADHG